MEASCKRKRNIEEIEEIEENDTPKENEIMELQIVKNDLPKENRISVRQSVIMELQIVKNDLPNTDECTNTDKQWISSYKRRKKSRNSMTDEDKNINGSVLSDKYIPEELLIEILSYVDRKSLLNCQLVCQHWKTVIQPCVWRKKAEQTIQRTICFDKQVSWKSYYCMSNKMPFNTNLIKNNSGQNGLDYHWNLPPIRSVQWTIEHPMIPLLSDDLSLRENVCFVTSSNMSWKYQIIDLIKEGFTSHLLDRLQPIIRVSEYFCCPNSPAKYICDIELLDTNGERKMVYHNLENYFNDPIWEMFDQHTFSKIMSEGEENQWYKYEYEFKNYGKGLRKIKFIHGGRKIHHYSDDADNDVGVKMTKACVKIELPALDYKYIQNLSSSE